AESLGYQQVNPRGDGHTFTTPHHRRDHATAVRQRTSLCMAAALVFVISQPSWANAQLTSTLVHCRASIGKGVRKLADAALKARSTCHKLRMVGSLSAGTDCNDNMSSPVSTQVEAARGKLASLTQRGCAAVSAAESPNVVCPAPCNSIVITDAASI